ncbi:PREDICTED: apyrase-like isoform X1 [Nicrophorus vespilloides]|uniref:apyrase n=1 Tax=Nicrophorus vespilloides TaxID=110193 RepID=A0ABM1M3H8_NICVS|nr:PREDICTED: apyrase-like isoform X1 [Nicrophorus vespilloides]
MKKCVFVLTAIAFLAIDCLEISIIHINDFHDRFEEQSETSGICRNRCHGGFSRMYSKIQDLMKTRKNPLLLNAGDNFKGTLWYSIHKWNVTQRFMNLLPFTAYTLGNHEFDDGIAGVVPFIKTMKAPLVLANVDDSLEPDFQALYNKSIIVEVEGKRIGVIGVILSTANKMSLTEKLKFLDEIESVNAEAERLMEKEGVFSVIVLSHSGYEKEMEIAKKAAKGISVIVGGHSHSLLYNGIPPDNTTARGPYPTVINREVDNGTVLVVQSSCYTKYIGDLVVNYDDFGGITTYKGNSIYLDHSLPKDKAVDDLLRPYKELVAAKGEVIVGSTEVHLDISDCRYAECNIGNFIADAMLHHCKNCSNIYGALSLMHVGGLRTSIPIGNITYNDLIGTLPFSNTFDLSDVRGEFIKSFFEQTTIPHYKSVTSPNVNLVQVSGCKVVYNLKNPIGNRVKSIQVLRGDGKYEELDSSKEYKVITASYVTRGGDGFQVITDNLRNTEKGSVDVDVVADYLRGTSSPVRIGKEGRLVFE